MRPHAMRGLAAGLALAGWCGCVTPGLLPVTTEQVARAENRWPDMTAERLQAARTLCASRCSGCHAPPDPRDRAPALWPGEVQRRAQRSHLDANQGEDMARYLETGAAVGEARPVVARTP